MKKHLLSILLLFATLFSAYSQIPDAFNYQSVVRNASGELISNQDVSFKISILQDSESGTPVYVETHFITTNDFGLANFKIGQGTVESGIFAPGGWGLNSHYLKLEIDAEGGSSYLHMGTSQLLSVPYAFHAQTVAEDEVDDADADATNELQTVSLSGTELTLSEGGGTVDIATNQTLAISGNDLSISDGNTVTIPDMADDWGTQAVETNFSLTGDGTAADPLKVFGNLTDDQTLSLSGNDLTISSGNTVALMMPYAYGHILSTGAKNWCTPNVGTVTKLSTAQYKVEIAGLGTDYTVVVTPNQGNARLTGVVTGRGSTYFVVSMWDSTDDVYYAAGFSFIVYKP